MKTYNIFKLCATVLIGIALFTFGANAQEPSSKELKLKTTIANPVVKNKIETITNSLKGVAESEFSISEKTLTVKYNPEEINSDMLMHLLKMVGYDTEIVDNGTKTKSNLGKSQNKDIKDTGKL